MTNTNKTTWNKAKAYLAPAILGAGLLLGGCGRERSSEREAQIPVAESTYSELRGAYGAKEKERESKYNSLLENAVEGFNEAIFDGNLSVKEQNKILKKFDEAFDLKDTSSKDLGVSDGTNKLYQLMSKNVNGFDMGTSELEKELKKQNLNVEVAVDYSRETGLVLLSSLSIPILYGLISALRRS